MILVFVMNDCHLTETVPVRKENPEEKSKRGDISHKSSSLLLVCGRPAMKHWPRLRATTEQKKNRPSMTE